MVLTVNYFNKSHMPSWGDKNINFDDKQSIIVGKNNSLSVTWI